MSQRVLQALLHFGNNSVAGLHADRSYLFSFRRLNLSQAFSRQVRVVLEADASLNPRKKGANLSTWNGSLSLQGLSFRIQSKQADSCTSPLCVNFVQKRAENVAVCLGDEGRHIQGEGCPVRACRVSVKADIVSCTALKPLQVGHSVRCK